MTEATLFSGSFLFLLWLPIAVIIGAFCSSVAAAKNLGSGAWFIGGMLFNIIALIAVAGMPTREYFECEKCKARLQVVSANVKIARKFTCPKCGMLHDYSGK